MNKKIETRKIKVDNFAELFAEMRKWKNSGGEWKLLEKHSAWTPGDGMTEYSKTGFIISNGTKKVDIIYELDTPDPELTTLLSPEEKKELREIFPKEQSPFFYSKLEVGKSYSVKNFGKDKNKVRTSRYLNSWSFNDICKILVDYYQANKTEIDQSTEKSLSKLDKNRFALSAPWIETNFFIFGLEKEILKKVFIGVVAN